MYERCSENNVVSLQRIQWALRVAAEKTFPGLLHDAISADDVIAHSGAGKHVDLHAKVYPRLTIKAKDILHKEFNAAEATFPCFEPTRPQDRRPDVRQSISHNRHPQQPAFEFCLNMCPREEGRICDWRPVERSFLGGFVNHVHSRSGAEPSVLLHRVNLTLHLVLTVLAERL